MYRFIVLLALVLPHITQAQHQVQKSTTPSWITPVDYSTDVSDTLNTGGQYYLLTEWQYHAEKKQHYRRNAIKVITEKGLESASSIQVNFDPSNQKLVFHTVVIRRDNKEIDILRSAKFEILRREENMDRLIYDKSLDAILNLEDVHVGDIVEYSYSVVGQNPVFEDKIFESVRLNFSVPVGETFDRIICSTRRHLNFKKFNQAAEPETQTIGDLTSYEWKQIDVPALFGEDNTPSWYSPYNKIQVSEYKDWTEVNSWALGLFSTEGITSKEIDNKLSEIKRDNLSLEKQINSAIRFVQDEVRYLSFSDGVQSYKPHNPVTVFKQRFGDCKDKSFLLSFMLNKLGVESFPALVHSQKGKALRDALPMPTLFDHCIAQLQFNDTLYWVDPTVTLDRGGFKASTQANYHHALVISPSTKSLISINLKPTPSTVQVSESYSFEVVGGSAKLNVKTVYEGDEATTMRNYYKSNSAQEIKKNYTNFYARDYSETTMVDYVAFEDNVEKNIVTTTENYNVENFWQYDSATGSYTADLYARVLAQNLSLPASKTRHSPLAVNYPVSVIQHISIHLSEPWTVTEKSKTFSSPAFKYTSAIDYVDETIKLDYKYESLKDHVTPQESKNHIDKIDKTANDLDFQLTYTPQKDQTAQSDFNMPYFVITLMLVPFMVLAFKRLYHYDPRSRDYSVAYEQFGGWLILPVIGIFLSPLQILINIFQSEYFNNVYWEEFTNPSYASYNRSLALLHLFEFVLSILFVGFYLLLIVLLVKRRTSFPSLVIFAYCLNVFYIFVETGWLYAIDLPLSWNNSMEAMKYFRPVFGAIVWIPFFLYSDRVKGTFRERL
ncbi:MAG: DUF3857 domain-containing protein [Chryseolinea sp.]